MLGHVKKKKNVCAHAHTNIISVYVNWFTCQVNHLTGKQFSVFIVSILNF